MKRGLSAEFQINAYIALHSYYSNALESISTQHQADLQQARDQARAEAATLAGKDTDKVQGQIEQLQAQMEDRDLVSGLEKKRFKIVKFNYMY